jgi:hypothetical protein
VAKLFLPTPEEANWLVAVGNQIAVLQGAIDAPLSILMVVDTIGKVVGDPGEVLTDYQLWTICQKCQLLFFNFAREKIPILQNWDDICLEGLEAAERVGISIMKTSQIVRNYYQDLRLKRKFQVRILGRDNLPPFLEQNKDISTTMQ